MSICVNSLRATGKLQKHTNGTTVRNNLGFHVTRKRMGMGVKTTAVGDRYVLEEMLAGGYGFGGEQSGHLINLETGTTGDGLATSLLLLEVMVKTGAPLAELARVMTRLPQKLVNVRVADMRGLPEATALWELIDKETARLGDSGRVLVRPSGTEPVVRVMVEAVSAGLCDEVCGRIVTVVEKSPGVAG